MKSTWFAPGLALLALPLMVACGGGSTGGSTLAANTTTTTPGSLVYAAPARQVSLSAADFQASLTATQSGAQLYALATGGVPGATLPCGVDVYKIQYYTQGGAGETTTSSGALMVPTGTGCTGPRPIVLYAHGTTISKNYDISALQISSNPANSESALVAAMYASNGFIVVAPNYAGYDVSPLPYHPYLNAKQSAQEMQDALKAARAALPNALSSTGDAGLLFVTGYSQGGHVAMATVRALEAGGVTVNGSAPMSGPYAMEAFGDAIFAGNVDIGATVFVPLITTSYQKAYGNLYSTPADLYTATYATGIDTLLPTTLSEAQLFTPGASGNSLLPETALFDSAPSGPFAALPQNPNAASNGDFGFGTSYLVNDAARAAYLADAAPTANPDPALLGTGVLPAASPQSAIRADLRTNDLRLPASGPAPLWLPKSPMLLCAGGNDPTVFSLNTKIMQVYFGAAGTVLGSGAGLQPTVLNIDPSTTSVAQLSSSTGADTLFQSLEAAFNSANSAEAAVSATQALQDYHGNVAPFCTAASALYFKSLIP